MAWAGCSHRCGWSSVPWCALAKVRAGAGTWRRAVPGASPEGLGTVLGGPFPCQACLGSAGRVSLSRASTFAGSCCRFPSGSLEPLPRRGIRCPRAARGPSWHRVRNVCAGQGGGTATQRKGKAASLFFLLQTLSHFNRWERQGSRLCPTAAWPWASKRESELDTIPSMSDTGSLPCRPRRVRAQRWEGLGRTAERAEAIQCFFFFGRVFFHPTSAQLGLGGQEFRPVGHSAARWFG